MRFLRVQSLISCILQLIQPDWVGIQVNLEELRELMVKLRSLIGLALQLFTSQLFRIRLVMSGFMIFISQFVAAQKVIKSSDSTSLAPSVSSRPTIKLSLTHAVEMALKDNSVLKEAKEKVTFVEYQIPQIRSQLMPNISIVGNGGTRKDAVNKPGGAVPFDGDAYNQYSVGLHVSQPLFGYGSLSAIESTRKDRDIARVDSEMSERDLISNVIQAYFQMVLSARNLKTLEQELEIVRESLATAQKRSATGRGQVLDVLQIRTQIELLNSQIENAKNLLDVAAITLISYWGERNVGEIQTKDSLIVPSLVVIDQKLETRKVRLLELEKNQIQLNQIQDKREVALGAHLPNLSVVADYTYSSYKKADLLDSTGAAWTLGLQLTIPLFSGFTSIYQQKSLISQEVQFLFERRAAEDKLLMQQVVSRRRLETAERTIRMGEAALKLAESSMNEARKNFRYATIDFLQYLSVQQSYIQAESTLNAAKYSYIAALALYYASSGQEMRQLVELLETSYR